MSSINTTTLVPLLVGAINRHGAHVADLVEHLDGPAMIWESSGHTARALPHVESTDPMELVFAAELIEEAAMLLLVAAKKLRKDAGQ